MLEVVALIFITKEIGALAGSKGLRPIAWKIYTILSWIFTEIVGIMVGIMIFGKDNLFSIFLIGVTFSITSYFFIKAQLNKLPDQENEPE